MYPYDEYQSVSGIRAEYGSSEIADELAVKDAHERMSKSTIALILLGAVALVGVGALVITAGDHDSRAQ